MRVFALSDVHIDYEVNSRWISGLSTAEYQEDVLILAGDVSDTPRLLAWCLETLATRFRKVLFVPGNHDLWVIREDDAKNSLQKFDEVCALAEASGASLQPYRACEAMILPLFSWYDYSFGEPTEELRSVWMDYRACRWPVGYTEDEISAHFAALNDKRTGEAGGGEAGGMVITYSHFLPRIDVMPAFIPAEGQLLYPVLGTTRLDRQLRSLDSRIHVYGHSHVRRHVTIDGVSYVNNAIGYPSETWLSTKGLKCIHEC
jgi:predicted phosphodiesterase